jgi:transcriptional regulator with XRE-family HTH domain
MDVSLEEVRYELKLFLRSRRERLSPDGFGIQRSNRRRTPGLTRDEVAQLAGIGTTTYTFLEQGRPINVSSQVLEKLAKVLLLNSQEKRHLFRLAIGELPRLESVTADLTPEVQSMLNQYGNIPAFVLNRRFDVIAKNHAASVVFGFKEPTEHAVNNNILLELASPAAKEQFGEDQEQHLRNTLSFFRLRYPRYSHDPSVRALVRRLRKYSVQFDDLWNQYDLSDGSESLKPVQMNHPRLGRLHAHFKFLLFFGMPEVTLCVVIPLDGTDTAKKIAGALEEEAS